MSLIVANLLVSAQNLLLFSGMASPTTSDTDFPRLYRMVMELRVHWQMFEELFLDAQNEEILQKSGYHFWDRMRDSLTDSVFLGISRWMDPAETKIGGKTKANFSLKHIINCPEVSGIKASLEIDLAALKLKFDTGIKTWRDWIISHNDEATVSGREPLPEILHVEAEELVNGIFEIMDKVRVHVEKSVPGIKEIMIPHGVSTLVACLRRGIQSTERSIQRQIDDPFLRVDDPSLK